MTYYAIITLEDGSVRRVRLEPAGYPIPAAKLPSWAVPDHIRAIDVQAVPDPWWRRWMERADWRPVRRPTAAAGP